MPNDYLIKSGFPVGLKSLESEDWTLRPISRPPSPSSGTFASNGNIHSTTTSIDLNNPPAFPTFIPLKPTGTLRLRDKITGDIRVIDLNSVQAEMNPQRTALYWTPPVAPNGTEGVYEVFFQPDADKEKDVWQGILDLRYIENNREDEAAICLAEGNVEVLNEACDQAIDDRALFFVNIDNKIPKNASIWKKIDPNGLDLESIITEVQASYKKKLEELNIPEPTSGSATNADCSVELPAFDSSFFQNVASLNKMQDTGLVCGKDDNATVIILDPVRHVLRTVDTSDRSATIEDISKTPLVKDIKTRVIVNGVFFSANIKEGQTLKPIPYTLGNLFDLAQLSPLSTSCSVPPRTCPTIRGVLGQNVNAPTFLPGGIDVGLFALEHETTSSISGSIMLRDDGDWLLPSNGQLPNNPIEAEAYYRTAAFRLKDSEGRVGKHFVAIDKDTGLVLHYVKKGSSFIGKVASQLNISIAKPPIGRTIFSLRNLFDQICADFVMAFDGGGSVGMMYPLSGEIDFDQLSWRHSRSALSTARDRAPETWQSVTNYIVWQKR